MKFDLFVLPFTLGLVFLLGYLTVKYATWYFKLEKSDRLKVRNGFFSAKLFGAIREIISESLLHRRIFQRNRLLGFMHMSLAFGWFLLIAIGNLESRVYQPTEMNPPYIPIFFKFFHANPGAFPLHREFSFFMDLLLLFVLSGVMLALAKRIYSRAYGMKRTTKLIAADRFALTSLWLIFPLRLLARVLLRLFMAGETSLQPRSETCWEVYCRHLYCITLHGGLIRYLSACFLQRFLFRVICISQPK